MSEPPTLFDWGEPPDPLRDLVPPSHTRGPDTEKIAAAGIRPRAGRLRVLALRALAEAPHGMTHGELAEATGEYLYSIAPRVTELQRDGLVADTGRRHTTDRGRPAVVWAATGEGRAALARIDSDRA
jgi:hypothetical protein